MSKKEIWKFIINLIMSCLTAAGTAFGLTSCNFSSPTKYESPDKAFVVNPRANNQMVHIIARDTLYVRDPNDFDIADF